MQRRFSRRYSTAGDGKVYCTFPFITSFGQATALRGSMWRTLWSWPAERTSNATQKRPLKAAKPLNAFCHSLIRQITHHPRSRWMDECPAWVKGKAFLGANYAETASLLLSEKRYARE